MRMTAASEEPPLFKELNALLCPKSISENLGKLDRYDRCIKKKTGLA